MSGNERHTILGTLGGVWGIETFHNVKTPTQGHVGDSAMSGSPLQEEEDDAFLSSYIEDASNRCPPSEKLPACETGLAPVTDAAPGLVPWFSSSQVVAVDWVLRDITEIGRGSYGNVYTGVLETGGHVVIKQPKANLVFSTPNGLTGLREALCEEARLQAICAQHSPYVVKVLGLCYSSCVIFLEYCRGGNLEAAVRGMVPSFATDPPYEPSAALRPWASRLQLLQQAATALAHIHKCRIQHNDLRAANCLLVPPTGPDDAWLLKVTDFGIACELPADHESTDAAPHHTHPLWAAPEVITSCRRKAGGKCCSASNFTDVYCFGGLVYEVLTGLEPHYLNEKQRMDLPPSPKARHYVSYLFEGKPAWQLELTEEVHLLRPREIDAATRQELAYILSKCCTHTARDRCTAVWLQERFANMQLAGQ